MTFRTAICLMLVFNSRLLASELMTNDVPNELTSVWQYINFPFSSNLPREPFFAVGSGGQYDQVSLGLRLDVLNITQGFSFFKTNAITARLYRADGEIVEPTLEGEKLINVPIAVRTASIPGEIPNPQVTTYFPWGSNVLEESWIEVTIASERYWLEIPYGFDRNPMAAPPPSNTNGPPKFISAMKTLTEHDHVVRWESVRYDLINTQGCWLSLIQSNPFYGVSKVAIYDFPGKVNIYSPHTEVHLLDADSTVTTGRCVDLHLDDDSARRMDTYEIRTGGRDNLRCMGQIEVSIATNVYKVSVPSSLYKYVHGHANKPYALYFTSMLRLGMALEEANGFSRFYIDGGIRNHPVSSAGSHRYEYVSKFDGSKVTLQFDTSDRLVSWESKL
jgi:hypothetical protein